MQIMLGNATGQFEAVEVHRLQALAETQRTHIEELNKQLHECLEDKMQQQLQLVAQSPARRNVRQLLARAAADNTALAKKVEELRAQRNALAVTKAALTAQMSELIRGAADDVQREVQHNALLTQLQQLYHLTGHRGADQPTTQMAAVFTFLQKAAHRHQALLAELQELKHTPAQRAHTPHIVAAAHAAITQSPTDQQLDKKATSQLIWWDGSCTDVGRAAAAAGGTPFAADVEAAAANDTGDESYKTGRSYFSGMSNMSPLKGIGRTESTLSSKTPYTAEGLYDDGLGSPLSCQSLSQLSSSVAIPAADIAPRRLSLEATPVSRYISTCGNSSESGSSNSSDTFATPLAVIKGLDHAGDGSKGSSNRCSVDLACSPSPSMLMSPVFGLKPEELQHQALDVGSVCNGRASAAAAAARPATSKQAGGLQLEPEFRLAACESVWPSPALVASAGGCRSDSSLSHALWLEQADFRSPSLSRILEADFNTSDAASTLTRVSAEDGQSPCRRSKRRRSLIIGMLVFVPVTIGAVAGGAAAWHFNQQEARQMFAALQKGLQLIAEQAHGAAAGGLRQTQQGLLTTCATAKQVARHCSSMGGKSGASHNAVVDSGPSNDSAAE